MHPVHDALSDFYGTTFDGDRLYMVHYLRIDPLEVVDLSDPTSPTIAGILEMPGWVERIAPMGNRLVGLGVDDSEGNWRVSVSLFDVTDATAPALLDRVTSGLDWSWSFASWERKAWTVDAREGLILFPYSGWNEAEQRQRNALGILELAPDGTVERLSPVNVPGAVIAMRDGGDSIVTIDRQWAERDVGVYWWGEGYDLWLNALDLRGDVAVRTARLRLGAESGSIAIAGNRAYAIRTEIAETTPESWQTQSRLAVIDLDAFAFTYDEELDARWWWGIAAVGPESLALSAGWYGGLALFDRTAPDAPSFTRFVPTTGWASSVVQERDTLYLCSGPWGIQTVDMP